MLCFVGSPLIFDENAVVPDDMWTPFKQLQRIVETFLSNRAPEGSLANLELLLQKHKPDFINLLRNSVNISATSFVTFQKAHANPPIST